MPIVEDAWEPVEVARDALRSLVVALPGVADWAIHFAIYTLPMLLLLVGVPALIGLAIYRQWKKRRPAGSTTTQHGAERDLIESGLISPWPSPDSR